MKKKIIISIFVIISLIGICCFTLLKNNDVKKEQKNDEIKEIISEEEKEISSNEITAEEETPKEVKEENKENKENTPKKEEKNKSSVSSNNVNNNNNSNNSTVKEKETPNNTQPAQSNNQPTQNNTPPAAPSCTPKKFINSWFIGEFTSKQACLDAGEKYMFDYSVSCPYLDDDCGTTYWMLQLIDRNGNIIDYHTLN